MLTAIWRKVLFKAPNRTASTKIVKIGVMLILIKAKPLSVTITKYSVMREQYSVNLLRMDLLLLE
jgi:hypothetical protein